MIGVIAIDKSIHIWIKLPSHFRIRSGLSIFIFGLNNGLPSWPVWIQFVYRSNGQYNLTMDIADHRLLPWFLRGHANSRATINIKFYSFDIVQIRVVSSLLAPVCSDGWWLCSLVDAGSYYCRINWRQAKESVSNMQKLHELAQNQLFEVRAQSGDNLYEIYDGRYWTKWWINH